MILLLKCHINSASISLLSALRAAGAGSRLTDGEINSFHGGDKVQFHLRGGGSVGLWPHKSPPVRLVGASSTAVRHKWGWGWGQLFKVARAPGFQGLLSAVLSALVGNPTACLGVPGADAVPAAALSPGEGSRGTGRLFPCPRELTVQVFSRSECLSLRANEGGPTRGHDLGREGQAPGAGPSRQSGLWCGGAPSPWALGTLLSSTSST